MIIKRVGRSTPPRVTQGKIYKYDGTRIEDDNGISFVLNSMQIMAKFIGKKYVQY